MLLTILLFACPEAAQTASVMALISIIVNPPANSSVTLTAAKPLTPNGCLGNLSNKSVIACTASKNYYKDIKVGDPAEEDTIVGPLVSKDQMETVLGYIEKGKEEGADVLIGGNKMDRKGYYVEPTVFVNVKNNMTIAQEEIFGPVLVVITYDNVDEAIELANDSIYGLSGGVVGPEEEAVKVARQIRTGNITINGAARSPKAPFGGYKQSGFGRENGLYGVEDYFEIKAIFN